MTWRLLVLGLLNAAALTVGLLLSRSPVSESADYPQRPIELVVPFSHGGGTDTFARVIAFAIEQNDLLPQPLTIINRGGAGATIGSRFVRDAEPDGYTMMVLHDALITAKYSGMVDYGSEAFDVIAGTGELGMVIAVAEDSPLQSLDDLLDGAEQQPQTVRFGANLGALTHFAGLQLEKARPGARFLFPQVGGGADRFSDLVGGHIDVTGFSIEEFHRFSTAGLRGLAYLGPERHPAAPDIPTALELGYEIVNTNMFFWWFPQGTPAEPIRVMRQALREAMETDYVLGKLAEIQCAPVFLTGEDLQARIDEAEQRFSQVVTRPPTVLVNLPWLLTSCCAALIVIIVVQHIRSAHSDGLEDNLGMLIDDDSEDELPLPARKRALLCLLVSAAYVGALVSGVGFILTTIVFVAATGTLLMPDARAAQILTLLLIGQCLGFGIDYTFTHIFEVSLP